MQSRARRQAQPAYAGFWLRLAAYLIDFMLLSVVELVPVHPFAVQENAVQAAVVKYAHPARLAMKQGVTARHRRVVEADVRGQATADPRPSLLQCDYAYSVLLLVRHVVPVAYECVARSLEPLRYFDLMGADWLEVTVVPKDRGAPKAASVTVGAIRNLVTFV